MIYSVECEEEPLDVIILFDVNARSDDNFKQQQERLIGIIRNLESITNRRDVLYGLDAFHRRPVILLSPASKVASNAQEVIDRINSLKPRFKKDSSPAKALRLAAEQLLTSRQSAHKLVIIAHDGESTDLTAETLEARNSLDEINAQIFAITSADAPNIPSLIGYTTSRAKVHANASDGENFEVEMEKAIGACTHLGIPAKVFGVPNSQLISINDAEKLATPGNGCEHKKINLMIVLDTSGSVFNVFAEERQLAHDLVASLASDHFENDRLEISVIRFSTNATIAIPFSRRQNRSEILEIIDSLQFTGSDTKITRAVDLALAELRRARRPDALQLFVLISDGYGQEFWHVVQTTSMKLHQSNSLIFAVSSSRDYNLAELTLYTGNMDQVYVGQRQSDFLPRILRFINECLKSSKVPVPQLVSFSAKEEQDTESMEPTKKIVGFPATSTTNSLLRETFGIFDTESVAALSSPSTEQQQLLTSNEIEQNNLAPTEVVPTLIESSIDELEPAKQNVALHQARAGSRGRKLLDHQVKLKNGQKNELIEAVIETNEIPSRANNKELMSSSSELRNSSQPIDLLFVIDRASNTTTKFNAHLRLANDLIERINDPEIENGRIQIGIISFDRRGSLDLEFENPSNKAKILEVISSIKRSTGEASTVTGINLATEYAKASRRSDGYLMVVLISGGNNQDSWNSVAQAAKKLHELPNIEVYAVTTSNQYAFTELETFTGDKWRVYVDRRADRFVDDAIKRLTVGEQFDEKDENILLSSGQSSSSNEVMDVIVLLDRSPSPNSQFETAENYAETLVLGAPANDYNSRIRISLVTFAEKAKIELELKRPTERDEMLYALQKVQNNQVGGKPSLATAIQVALSQLGNINRSATRPILLLISDGHSRDTSDVVNATVNKLHTIKAELYAVPITGNYDEDELLMYAGDKSRILGDPDSRPQSFESLRKLGSMKFVSNANITSTSANEITDKVIGTVQSTENELITEEVAEVVATVAASTTLAADAEEQTYETLKPKVDESDNENNLVKQTKVLNTGDISGKIFSTDNAESIAVDTDCKVDLMFVIDRSQSVEREFQKQLQFAIKLLRRIPSADFNSRVRVATVSFNDKATLNFDFNQFSTQSKILEILQAIEHTGGSTSAVSGVKLAADEIKKTGRRDARQMVVIISDGNGQDMWDDVVAGANLLRAVNATVYAVTANHNYYLPY